MPRPPLPTRLLRAFRDRSSNASADRIPHARNLEQVERLLDRAPVFLGNENSVAAFSSDVDRLVCLRGLIEEPVQLPPGLACRHRAQKKSSPRQAYVIPYVSATLPGQRERSVQSGSD